MRNIRIADPRDRVVAVARPAPAQPRRLRDWAATLPIMLLVPALALPFGGAGAAGPSLRVTPTSATPGTVLKIAGSGFPARVAGSLTWDGIDARVSFAANPNGSFRARLTVPAAAAAGRHVVAARTTSGTVASATVQVSIPVTPSGPEPTAAPTPAPTAPPATPSASATLSPTATPASPTATPTAAPAASGTPRPTATPAPTSAPTAAPTAAPSATPVPLPATGAVVVSVARLAGLSTSSAAWSGLKSKADLALGTPNLANQDDDTDITVLAKALVYARTGSTTYRAAALAGIKLAVGTEAGGRTLALGRNLPGYVVAADLISLRTLDPAFDQDVFRPWLRSLLTKNLDGRTLRSTHEDRPNNWGTHAGAARMAVAAYLGDTAELARAATVFRGWLGDRSAYAGFSYGDLAWQCDPAKPVGINPTGCSRSGIVIDGALPEEMRRGGGLTWPPTPTDYAWEGLQGAVLQAEILASHGHDAWSWSDRALLRAVRFLYDRAGWPAVGDDQWQPWLVDARYGTSYRGSAPARTGKNFGFTDWLFPS